MDTYKVDKSSLSTFEGHMKVRFIVFVLRFLLYIKYCFIFVRFFFMFFITYVRTPCNLLKKIHMFRKYFLMFKMHSTFYGMESMLIL
jgi:hypothetical protein